MPRTSTTTAPSPRPCSSRLKTPSSDAKADLVAAEQQLNMLGVDKEHPTNMVNVYAPISGVIIAPEHYQLRRRRRHSLRFRHCLHHRRPFQRVDPLRRLRERSAPTSISVSRPASSSTPIPTVRWSGTISDIGPVLDPNLRTAKVRIQVPNPGILRLGMFVTATLSGHNPEQHPVGPGQRRPPSARPRLGLHPRRRQSVQAPLKSTPATCSPAIARRSSPASTPANRSSTTHFCLNPRGINNDPRSRRFRSEKPLARARGRSAALRVGRNLLP